MSWSILTPSGPGAVTGVLLVADSEHELDALLSAELGARPLVVVGRVGLRRIFGVDDGLVARWSACSAELMVHGGAAVLRALLAALAARGVMQAGAVDARTLYPEAADQIEAEMLRMMARARSPMAVDVLIEHAARCRAGVASVSAEHARALARLVDPPLVVAVGPANIGKSTLVNALAGRRVSIVADEPGTTRDHVGAMVELGGVVVRYVDTPGLRDGAEQIEAEARAAALEVARGADLVLLCGDPGVEPVEPREIAGVPGVRVCLRRDLGEPGWKADAAVSAGFGRGVRELGELVAEQFVPAAARGAMGAWRFWE